MKLCRRKKVEISSIKEDVFFSLQTVDARFLVLLKIELFVLQRIDEVVSCVDALGLVVVLMALGGECAEFLAF